MGADRKATLKKRQEKSSRAEARKRACLDRAVRTLGVEGVFEQFPDTLVDIFVKLIGPGTEVAAAEGLEEDPVVRKLVREIQGLVKEPVAVRVDGRAAEIAYDDWRALCGVLFYVRHFLKMYRHDPRPRVRRDRELMEEAEAILRGVDDAWLDRVEAQVVLPMVQVIDRVFHLDGPMLGLELVEARKPEGGACDRLVLSAQAAEPHVVTYQGVRRTTFPCLHADPLFPLRQVTWDCRALGIEGPARTLPVYVEEHALQRFDERMPPGPPEPWPPHLEAMRPRLKPWLRRLRSGHHRLMASCLARPVVFPRGDDRCLVAYSLGPHRMGYFVAQVLPHMVLVKTFLFLTMQGTPESDLLHQKLGLRRDDVERYQLDRLSTFAYFDSDRDPLLTRVLSECGCGHLLSWYAPPRAGLPQWLDLFGERLKQMCDLREVGDGFAAGRRWTRWSA